MNKTAFALLAAALVLPATARADTLDDFVITGTGLSITFTLPASPPGNTTTCPPGPGSCVPGSETAFYLTTTVTTNGVSTLQSLAFPTILYGGGLQIGSTKYGADEQIFAPDAANPTFLTGSFTLFPFGTVGVDDTLTITPEAATSTAATPEPSSLALLTTGVVGLLSLSRIRRRA